MIEFVLGIFLGWPVIIVTMILVGIGLFKSNYRLLIVAAILVMPFSWFLSGFPVIQSPVFLLPLIPFTSAYFMYRGREMMAWVFAVPYFLVIWLLFNVIRAV